MKRHVIGVSSGRVYYAQQEYDESQHPRDENGRWTSGGGGGGAPSQGRGSRGGDAEPGAQRGRGKFKVGDHAVVEAPDWEKAGAWQGAKVKIIEFVRREGPMGNDYTVRGTSGALKGQTRRFRSWSLRKMSGTA